MAFTEMGRRHRAVPNVPRQPAWQTALWASLCLGLLLARLWPVQPLFPDEGRDNSWQVALDFATAHKMAIGRDLVFTYGPYADVVTRLYDPATRWLNMAAIAVLAAGLALPLAVLARPASLLCTVAMLPLVYSNEAFAFVLPLPAFLMCARTGQGPVPGSLPFALLVHGAAIALLPLIKLSYLPVAVIGAPVVAGLLWLAGKRRFALAYLALVGLAIPAWWCASGQAPADLALYLINGGMIMSGYAGAMATFGPPGEFASRS